MFIAGFLNLITGKMMLTKKFIRPTLLAAITSISLLAFSATSQAAPFVNGGFESGTLNGWTGGGGSWFGSPVLPVPASTYNGGTPNNTIMSGGTDAISGDNVVNTGKYSVRVNDSTQNYSVSTLRQSVTNYTDNNIFFAWNAVLEASHGQTDSDYFALSLVDDTTGTTLVSRSYSSASAPATFVDLGNGWFGSRWQNEQIDLAALGAVGHDFTLTLLASDCPYGGHAGYVYLDGFANVIVVDPVPEPATLALFGLGALGLGYARRRKTA
jgi:PEP-CTERM motif